MDLAKLGLKPFKKPEPTNEPDSNSLAGAPDMGSNNPSDDVATGIPATPAPAADAPVSSPARPNPLAALMAKAKSMEKAVVDAPKEEVKASQSAETKPESKAPEPVVAGKGALAALLAKNPKPEPKVESPGSSLPSTLDTEFVETIPVGPEGFQFHLDRLDALIQRDGGITALTQDTIKGKIKDIFTELNQFPEYDGLIIDRDVHNIMRFMQHSLSATKVEIEKKVAKRTTKAKAAESKPKFDFSGMEDMLLAGTQKAIPASVDALGTLDVDAIETKFKREFKK